MGLFKRKEREIKEDDSLLVKLWYTPRTHGLIVLGIYFVFFFVVMLAISGSPKNLDKEKKDSKVSEMKSLFTYLDGKNLTYDFNIKTEGNTYVFNGTRLDNEVSGKIILNDSVLNIKFVDGLCKVIERNRKGVEYISDKSCPEDINYSYFDYHKIYSLIEFLTVKNSQNTDYKLITNDGYSYKLYELDNHIDKIIITDNNSVYELKYIVNYTASDLSDMVFYKALSDSYDKKALKNNEIKIDKEKFESSFEKAFIKNKNVSNKYNYELSTNVEPIEITVTLKNDTENYVFTYNKDSINIEKINK